MGDRVLLHSLLEQFNGVQRKDIHDVTKGHLNENKLKQKKDKKDYFWGSSKKEPIWMRQKVEVKNHPIFKKQPLPPIVRKVGAKDVVADVKIISAAAASAQLKKGTNVGDSSSCSSSRRCGNEEFSYPETMVPVANQEAPFSKQFIPNHVLFPTKCEQYEQFKKTGKQLLTDMDEFLNDQDKVIQQIDEEMRQKLKLLQCKQGISLPNYFKFKIYSDAWEELNCVLGKDGEDLKCVKKDYDSYVNALLEEQVMLHEKFSVQDYNILSRSDDTEHGNVVGTEEEHLKVLEDELLEELKENEELRMHMKNHSTEKTIILPRVEVKREREKEKEEEKEEGEGEGEGEEEVDDGDTMKDLENHVITLHAKIEDQYYEIENIKKTQREEYVPRAVCQRLEQCIKEVEVDTQKLTKQNDFLEQDIQELEEELEKVLLKIGCKENDAKLLWDRFVN